MEIGEKENGREISFRVWHQEKEYMYKNIAVGLMGKVLYSRGNPKKRGADWYVSEEYDENIIVMQYTGLKDDRGKKIFESDVVSVGAQEKLAIVKWSTENARFELHFIDEDRQIDFADKRSLRRIKVLGNIYENPDLVGEGAEEES